MRIKSNIISVTYADRDILLPGGHIAADSYGWSRNFTTTAEQLLDASSALVRSYGNAQGEFPLPICADFDSEPEAIQAAVEATKHAELYTTGTLRLAVGDKLIEWQAGVQNLSVLIQYMPSSIRLTLTYNFTLGARVPE
jgi:hypothetical protein